MAKKQQTPQKTGRKPLEIDEKLVTSLAQIHCTMKEIASVAGCSVDTLERRFADTIEKGREGGKSSIRRLQWQAAEKGNIMMLIWLGKQILGQKDRQPDEATQVHFNVVTNEVPK